MNKSGAIRVILVILMLIIVTVLGARLKTAFNQSKLAMEAVFAGEKELGLDNLQRMGGGFKDEQIVKTLVESTIAEDKLAGMRSSFFSPYRIGEACLDESYASASMTNEKLNDLFKNIADPDQFCERLVSHVQSLPEAGLAGKFPASDTVLFAEVPVSFSQIHGEAFLWYLAGRYLAEKGNGPAAFKVFLGIVDLADAWENLRLCHPDKQRRLQSCIIREIAAVGIIESAHQLLQTKAQLTEAIEALKKRDSSFVSISQVLAFDRMIPVAFGGVLNAELTSGRAATKFKHSIDSLARIFGDKAEMQRVLDPLYKPMIEAASLPYLKCQRAFNPWNSSFEKAFSDMSAESTFGIFKIILFPDYFLQQSLLENFSRNLPFFILNDVKTRQLFNGARAALICNVFKKETGKWPASLSELEQWFEQPLPEDLIRGIPLQFKAGEPPYIASVGRDGRSDTTDDLVFMPFGQKAKE
ncbi:MAG: hypothetical protein AB1403_06080 [Candidatus Riflebacteria bacterium]